MNWLIVDVFSGYCQCAERARGGSCTAPRMTRRGSTGTDRAPCQNARHRSASPTNSSIRGLVDAVPCILRTFQFCLSPAPQQCCTGDGGRNSREHPFECPHCKEKLPVPSAGDERLVACPACANRVAVPELPLAGETFPPATIPEPAPRGNTPKSFSARDPRAVLGYALAGLVVLIGLLAWTTAKSLPQHSATVANKSIPAKQATDRVFMVIIPGTYGNDTFWPNLVEGKASFALELSSALAPGSEVYPFLWASSVYHAQRVEAAHRPGGTDRPPRRGVRPRVPRGPQPRRQCGPHGGGPLPA